MQASDSAGKAGTVAGWAAALCAAFIAVPWLNPFAPGPSPTVFPWLLAVLASIGAWWSGGARPPPRPWLLALALAAIGLLLRGPTLAPETMMALGALGLLMAGGGLGANAAAQGQLLRYVAAAWLLAALVSALAALVQYFGLAHLFSPWINITEPGEAFGNLRQRNQFATLTSIGVLALLWLVRPAAGRHEALAAAAIIVLCAANAASASRTGALQLLLVIALMVWWSRPGAARMLRLGAAGVLAYLVAAVGLPWAAQTLAGFSGGSVFQRIGHGVTCDSRMVLWSNVLELIAQRPWTGWGWGELDYAHYIHPYAGARFCDILDNAHDLPLQLAVELGVPFALLVCAALVWATWRGRPWREASPARQLGWGVLAIIMLHSLLEYPLWYGPFQFAFGIAAGLVMGPARAIDGVRRSHAAASLVAGGLGLALCGYALWDYHRVSQIYMAPAARSEMFQDDTLGQARRSWLFRNQARFAELTISSPTRDNAQQVHALAVELVHYSPEPRVIERLIESAVLLGLDDEAQLHLARLRAAFPAEYKRWTEGNRQAGGPVSD